MGHIHQKAVVKVLQTHSSVCPVPNHACADAECASGVLQRATLQGLGKHPILAQGSQAQNGQHPGPPYAAHKPSAGECPLPVVWSRPMPFVACGQAINLAPRYRLDLCCLLSATILSATIDGLTSPSSACCFASICLAWLDLAWLGFAMLCCAALCFALLCLAFFALLCFSLLCFALLCSASPCFALPCSPVS